MKIILTFIIFLSSFAGITQNTSAANTTTYFFIRHAEKDLSNPDNRNPQLTEEGKKRSQNWAKVLIDTKVDMVFTTDYIRTRETASPIAQSKNLETTLYDPRDLNNPGFQQKTKGKTSVIVGHSNTTPAFVNKVIGKEKYATIDEKDYGKLFIVKITSEVITDVVLNVN